MNGVSVQLSNSIKKGLPKSQVYIVRLFVANIYGVLLFHTLSIFFLIHLNGSDHSWRLFVIWRLSVGQSFSVYCSLDHQMTCMSVFPLINFDF